MSDKDDKKDRGRPNHPGSTAAENLELSLWLHRFWDRGEPPERLELFQMFGTNKAIRGEMIFHEDFKAGEKLDVEQANHLANEIMASAQNDCDSVRRRAWYQLIVVDRNRKAQPLVRRIGPLEPKRAYALATAGDADDEDEDGAADHKTLAFRYAQESLSQVRWDKSRTDSLIGDVVSLLGGIAQDLRADNRQLREREISFFAQLQDSMDRSADRQNIREREQFNRGLMQEGVRTVRNLMPGLFGPNDTKPTILADDKPAGTAGTNGGQAHGPSPERTLVDNLLCDCEKEEDLAVALFGDFKEEDGKLVLVKPGIFSVKQYAILVGVRDGRKSIDELDTLLPGCGHENAITQEQIQQAVAAGVTDGIGIALTELVGLRHRRKQAAQAEHPPTQETTP